MAPSTQTGVVAQVPLVWRADSSWCGLKYLNCVVPSMLWCGWSSSLVSKLVWMVKFPDVQVPSGAQDSLRRALSVCPRSQSQGPDSGHHRSSSPSTALGGTGSRFQCSWMCVPVTVTNSVGLTIPRNNSVYKCKEFIWTGLSKPEKSPTSGY